MVGRVSCALFVVCPLVVASCGECPPRTDGAPETVATGARLPPPLATSSAGVARADCVDEVAFRDLCGSAWQPGPRFLGAIRQLSEGGVLEAQRMFADCASQDAFCNYGVALTRKYLHDYAGFRQIAESVLSSGKVQDCLECRLIIMRDLGLSYLMTVPKDESRGTALLGDSCELIEHNLGEVHLYGHTGPCRMAVSALASTAGPGGPKRNFVGVQGTMQMCDDRWRAICSPVPAEHIIIGDIWW